MMRTYSVPLARLVAFVLVVFALHLGFESRCRAQGGATPGSSAQDKEKDQKPPAPVLPGSEYSGMYNFLREGEFVQVTVEEQGRVTGFVSRYGDSESDRGEFLDHFFKQGTGKLEGNRLTFATDTVHGVWFEFRGTVERGEGKNPGDEAFYVLKGTLVENSTDEQKKATSRSREVTLKSFPQDVAPTTSKRN